MAWVTQIIYSFFPTAVSLTFVHDLADPSDDFFPSLCNTD